MTAGGHTKFLFDRDFSDPEDQKDRAQAMEKAAEEAADQAESEEAKVETAPEPELPPPPTFSEEDVERAREEGRQAGRDEAARDLAGAMEQRVADTLQATSSQIAQVLAAYERDKEQHSRDAVAVASVIVRKLFPALNMDKAMAEIEHMIVEAMKRTSGSPMLIVRVSEDMQAEVAQKAQELAALRGREGTINVIGDADVAPGDARVEWEGGGMVRDSAFIWREIDEIIESNLGQRLDVPDHSSSGEPGPASEAHEPDDAPTEAAEAEVVNPAAVGENEGNVAESDEPSTAADEIVKTED